MKLSAVQGRVAPDPARGEDGEREEAAGENLLHLGDVNLVI